MKKQIMLVSLVFVAAIIFSACKAPLEQKTMAEQMLSCLSQCDMAGAAEYLSPEMIASSRSGLLQIANALNGRTVENLTETDVYYGIRVDKGYLGIEKRINYQVILSDGAVGQLQTIHYARRGFVGFHLNLGSNPTAPNDGFSTI